MSALAVLLSAVALAAPPHDRVLHKGVTANDWRPVPDTIARWRELDACAATSETTAGAITRSVSACTAGTAVELDTIAGGGHSWPGGQRMSVLLDPASPALDATRTLWRFFAAHPRA